MRLGYIGLLQVKCWQFVHNLCCPWHTLVPCCSCKNGGIDLEWKPWRSAVYRQFPPEVCRNVNPAPKLLLGDYKEFEDGLMGFERSDSFMIHFGALVTFRYFQIVAVFGPKQPQPTNQ